MRTTQVCVVGGGPAALMLGLLMARQGIEVVVLEKHADFLRDFRGDTVHSSTLAFLDELGLGEKEAKLPGRHDAVVAQGLDALKTRIAKLVPFLADRVAELSTWDDVKLLTVKVNRLEQWHGPGYLLIGDVAQG